MKKQCKGDYEQRKTYAMKNLLHEWMHAIYYPTGASVGISFSVFRSRVG